MGTLQKLDRSTEEIRGSTKAHIKLIKKNGPYKRKSGEDSIILQTEIKAIKVKDFEKRRKKIKIIKASTATLKRVSNK